jgi:hypothetical protein
VAKERERCAKIADEHNCGEYTNCCMHVAQEIRKP